MKKIFTLAAAVLASFSLMAAVVTWRPTSADVTELIKTTPTAVTVGTGDQSFQVYSVRPFYNTNAVKLEWDETENAIKTTDNAIDKAGLAVYIPAGAEVTGITVYIHTSQNRKTYYAAPQAEKPSKSGTKTSSAVAQTSTGYDFWSTFDADNYYAFGGKSDGGGELYYDSVQVTFKDATEPFLKAITVAGVECEIVKAADAADPDTIKGELPYGTVINDAIDAAVIPLGGTATAYEVATDHSKLTVTDGINSKVYAFNLTVSASASTDATLKSLSINGVAITLEEGVYEYNIELSYADDVEVAAEANDPSAKSVVVDKAVAGKVTITVTAQAENTQVYTVNYTILPAKKDLLEAAFSNGAKGAITNGKIRVPYLAGEAAPTFVAAKFWNADGEPTAVVEGNNLKVTGADGVDSLYAIETVELAPAAVAYDTEITFDSTETYIFSTYGFGKEVSESDYRGWRFAKAVEEANNKRISDGRARLYFAIPAADSLVLVSGTAADRAVKIYVNGVENSVTKTAKKNEAIILKGLNPDAANFIAIESNQTNGDGGFIKMTVGKPTATAISNTNVEVKAIKRIIDGKLVIEKKGVLYNAQGIVVK